MKMVESLTDRVAVQRLIDRPKNVPHVNSPLPFSHIRGKMRAELLKSKCPVSHDPQPERR